MGQLLNWRVGRLPYAIWLGVIVGFMAPLANPTAILCGYALLALLTAARMQALELPVRRAFLPLALLVGGMIVARVLSEANARWIASHAHAAARLSQIFISVQAALRYGPGDKMSRTVRLARDLRAKGRQLRQTINSGKPAQEESSREAAILNALIAERVAHVGVHGHSASPERALLDERIAAQLARVQRLNEAERSRTEQLTAETRALNEALAAWRERNQRGAA